MIPDNSAYHASIECWNEDIRTSITDNNRIVWTAGDKITIFEGNDVGKAFQVDPSLVGKSYADFLPVDESDTDQSVTSFEGVLAMYPYSSAISLSLLKTGGLKIDDIIFPTEQAYDPDTFSDDSFLMTPYASNGSKPLSFKNVCGVLKLELTGDFDVAEIIIEGNSGELISGHGTILIDKTGPPSVEMSDGHPRLYPSYVHHR